MKMGPEMGGAREWIVVRAGWESPATALKGGGASERAGEWGASSGGKVKVVAESRVAVQGAGHGCALKGRWRRYKELDGWGGPRGVIARTGAERRGGAESCVCSRGRGGGLERVEMEVMGVLWGVWVASY